MAVDTAPLGRTVPNALTRRHRTEPAGQPHWVAPLLAAAVGALYLNHLDRVGFGNAFYSGATWAGTRSAKAWLFGAIDPGATVTVDKPPLSTWLMTLSARVFGFSGASTLVPQVLMGVVSVAAVYAIVRRLTDWRAALPSAVCMALLPANVLIYRYNNPDAVMNLCLLAAAAASLRLVRRPAWPWALLAGSAVGLAFLAKMLEGLIAAPAFALLVLLGGQEPLRRRAARVGAAAAAALATGGSYVLLLQIWPANLRPYLGESATNSFLDLVIGYNGLARIVGRSTPSASAGNTESWWQRLGLEGGPGPFRLFTGEFALESSWILLPATAALLWVLWRRRGLPRDDLARAVALSMATWLFTHALVISLMRGIVHPYYTSALAAPAAILLGLGVDAARKNRLPAPGRLTVASVVLLQGAWEVSLYARGGWDGATRWAALLAVATVVVAAALLVVPSRWWSNVTLVSAFVVALAPAGYAVATIDSPHGGVNPVLQQGAPPVAGTVLTLRAKDRPTTYSPEFIATLRSAGTPWAAAVRGSYEAANLEVQARVPVMPIGGFHGTDATPALPAFLDAVRRGQVRYYVIVPEPSPTRAATQPVAPRWWGGPAAAMQNTWRISEWARTHYDAITMFGTSVYDLS